MSCCSLMDNNLCGVREIKLLMCCYKKIINGKSQMDQFNKIFFVFLFIVTRLLCHVCIIQRLIHAQITVMRLCHVPKIPNVLRWNAENLH